ncbi:MAG: hypothetical protein RLZZ360_79 [Candidatus Parcubacteria bacterium]|jgi:thiol-disulfide isomerase/thioredoxin
MFRLKQSNSVVLIVLLVIILVLVWFTYQIVTRHRQVESDAGRVLLDTQNGNRFTDMNGVAVQFNETVGEGVIYVNTWASWSPLSRDELIALNEVAGEFKDKPITFIALNRRESTAQAQAFLATLPPLPNLTVVIDSTDEFYHEIDGYAMPETVLYTRAGELWRHERQPQSSDSIRSLARELLETQ